MDQRPPLPTPELIERILYMAAAVIRERTPVFVDRVVEQLAPFDPQEVRGEAERVVLARIAAAWGNGWQPRELARYVRRTSNTVTVGLCSTAIAADHAERDPDSLDPRWIVQLHELELPRTTARKGWLAEWGRTGRLSWTEEVRGFATLLGSLMLLVPIAILLPPPGAGTAGGPTIDLTVRGNDPMLNRVRALLAKAESTTFEAEAEAFTAKAQQLMTRHAIDMAMLAAGANRSDQPDTIRIPVDDPYVDAKSLLLQVVAGSSRCRAAYHPRLAMVTVVGFADDLAAAEVLFTSLLVQAQVALQATTTTAPPGARARSRTFRNAFLHAYAHRVSERLDEINAHVVADAEAETGQSIMPVLAARSTVVDAAISEMFGKLQSRSRRQRLDSAGYASGRLAADRARLNHGDLDGARPALRS